MNYQINNKMCRGCGLCVQNCPEGIQLGDYGLAVIINEQMLDNCGGEKLCPFGAIEDVDKNPIPPMQQERDTFIPNQSGMGQGMGRGMGIGPRDGRGRGRGGGGRRR